MYKRREDADEEKRSRRRARRRGGTTDYTDGREPMTPIGGEGGELRMP